jgi:hypothetical protein
MSVDERVTPAPDGVERSAIRRAWAALTAGPDYPATEADRRTVSIAGLRVPVRATVAVTVVTFAVLFDYSHTFLPADVVAAGRTPATALAYAIERFVLFGMIPFAVVILAFSDSPRRYGLTLGDWRWGTLLVVVGCIVMTPIVLWFATLPEAQAYYGPSAGTVGQTATTYAIELIAAEFAFRGFLMLTLVRVVGPIGVLIAAWPFVFAHLGKPELELFSTLGGGLVYGWLAWRTRSIVWGAIGHTYILTLVTLAAAHAIPL